MAGKKKCEHVFVATSRKGQWTVHVKSTNNRGNPADEQVTTTVFECSGCGATKEYPDIWERNYIAPEDAGKITPPAKKRAVKRDTGGKKKNGKKSA